MLISCSDEHALRRAKVIAEGIKDVAAELRLVDAADFVSFIHLGQFGNIRDIVNSSIELYYKHGTLSYACSADYELEWDGAPTVYLDLEFCHRHVVATFKLALRARNAGIELRSISFGDDVEGADMETMCLMAAIADAKLPPAPR
ncbi:MAG: hypothetical protein ACLQIQ_03805 [Beijerinckiaceae bacterium]